MSGHRPQPTLKPGENPGSSSFQGRMAAWRSVPAPGPTQGPPADLAAAGTVPDLDPNDFWIKFVGTDEFGNVINDFLPVPFGTPGATFDDVAWAAANKARTDVSEGIGGPSGPSGPTAAELAIQRSQVQAQNLSTFIQGTIAELSAEIDAKRLSTEQALGEFNKRLDAFAEAGEQFIGIQPFTIAPGSKFFPGRGPGDIGEAIGRPILEASPIDFDPFGEANRIVAESPSLTDIGVPTGNALDEAIEIARGFLGG